MAKKQKQDWIPKPADPAPQCPAAPVVAGKSAERLEARALYALVLLCGIGLMSLEMVGARVLWNNFGSSVFVWGSIISVFMAALALGYYLGGHVADRKPSLTWLAGIVAAAGVLVLVVTHVSVPLCDAVDEWDLGARAGPLVASSALYFLPSVLLGMISPFAVRLQAKTLASVGNVAGRLYALSTVGSLAGTLLTTFLLIPLWGTSLILYAIGVTLIGAAVLGLAARFAARGGPRSRAGVVATILFLGGSLVLGYVTNPTGLPFALPRPRAAKINEWGWENRFEVLVSYHESAYHNIAVVERFNHSKYGHVKDENGKVKTDKHGNPLFNAKLGLAEDPDAVREMRFNDLTESALYINKKGHPPQTTYTRILHLGMALNQKARRVLVVGLGGGSVPREFCEVYKDNDMEVDVVEVDPQVVKVAREHFFHKDENGVKTYVADGRQFIRRGSGRHKKYDLIILDAYSGGGQIPAHLVTLEFLEQVRARLEPKTGVLVSNIISGLEGTKSRFFRAEYKTMKRVFGNIYVFPSSLGNPGLIRNVILVATQDQGKPLLKSELVAKTAMLLASYPQLKKRAERREYNRDTGKYDVTGDLTAFADQHFPIIASDLTDLPVLTDEYAPVETMFWWTTRQRG